MSEIDINKIDEQLDNKEAVTPISDDRDFGEIIEEGRIALYDKYKKTKVRSNIMMGAVVILLIASFILIAQTEIPALPIIGYSLAGVIIVGMIVYYVLTKNKFPEETKKYIKLVTTSLNGYTFKDGRYKDVTNDPDEKLELAEIASDCVYTNLSQIGSRNVIRGLCFDRTMLVGDLALYSGDNKTREARFVGKYISLRNDLSFEGRIVITKQGNEPIDVPNGIDDLVSLEKESNFEIFGKENCDYKDILGTKFISMVKAIELDSNLLGYTIVIWGGHTAVYLSYSDAVISLPFNNEFDREAHATYVKNQNTVLDALALHIK